MSLQSFKTFGMCEIFTCNSFYIRCSITAKTTTTTTTTTNIEEFCQWIHLFIMRFNRKKNTKKQMPKLINS